MKLTIEFANAEDCSWAMKMIEKARERTEEMKPYGGTPLAGASASILLTALGRSLKTTSDIAPEAAKKIRMGAS